MSDDIPCAENLKWCRAICCSLKVVLSEDDDPGLERDGAWIAHANGRCVYVVDGGCSIYPRRPAPCRAFDCRKDRRIWVDYEQRIPNPNLDKLFLAATNARHLRVLPK